MMNKGFGSNKKFGIPEFAYSGKVKPGVLSPKSIVPDHIGIIIIIIIIIILIRTKWTIMIIFIIIIIT